MTTGNTEGLSERPTDEARAEGRAANERTNYEPAETAATAAVDAGAGTNLALLLQLPTTADDRSILLQLPNATPLPRITATAAAAAAKARYCK